MHLMNELAFPAGWTALARQQGSKTARQEPLGESGHEWMTLGSSKFCFLILELNCTGKN